MHILLGLLLIAPFIFSFVFFQARGGTVAERDYQRAVCELDKAGQTVVQAFWRRTVDLDVEGFAYGGQRVSWLDVTGPLATDRVATHSYAIVCHLREKNRNLGKKRMFADTKSKFIKRRVVLPGYYKMGTNRVLKLMNMLREQAFTWNSLGIDLWHNTDDDARPARQSGNN